jgi:hypothetical protein
MTTPGIASSTETGHAFQGPLWFWSWVAFAAFHASLMGLDWHLRDHHASTQPMPGGLPDWLNTLLAVASFFGLGAALYCALPSSWPVWRKGLLVALQVAIAYPLLAWAELYYVVSNGIDTL